jgi:predicted NAD/FAD-binding protein
MNKISPSREDPLSIAVVGTGIAGMSAAWLLSQKHDVTVFEQNDRLGGHAHTVDVVKSGHDQPVDTGFIVYNEINYPNLVALFEHLGVQTQASDMTFSVSLEQGIFEFGSKDLNSVFGQRSNTLKPKFWSMLSDIRRFFEEAQIFLSKDPAPLDLTLGQFLDKQKYGQKFIEQFILPMGAAIWSTRPEEMREQPAHSFIQFFNSHGLLHFKNQVPWRTVTRGSRSYVEKLTAEYRSRVKLGNAVKSVTRKLNQVEVIDSNGQTATFDHVVIATHGDEALNMLADPDQLETELLGAFRYTDNRILLHSDPALMPKRKQVWSSWNFLGTKDNSVSVTYWMNLLQNIDDDNPLFVSVNPKIDPNPDLLHRSFQYQHPFFDIAAWTAQRRLWNLQGQNNTWFCGSYFGYGFHEDALQSGLAVAEELGGIERPWKVKNESGRIHRLPANNRMAAE